MVHLKETIRSVVRSSLRRLPPIARLLEERDQFAAEARRLKRRLSALEASPQPYGAMAAASSELSQIPTRLNLGCGFDHRKGYLNIDLNDFHQPDLVADVKSLPMLPSGYFDEILALDVLEHLYRDDTEVALVEWSRLLRKGGVLTIRVPSVLDWAELMRKVPKTDLHGQRSMIQNLFGTQAYNGDFHYTAFTRSMITRFLTDAGFAPQSEERWRVIDGWMIELSAEKV